MTEQQIDKLYPEFWEWIKKEKRFITADGIWLIKLWYEFLEKAK